MADFVLPRRIPAYLRRLQRHYSQNGPKDIGKVLECCRVYIREGEHFDNWNGGTYGHEVVLFIPEEKFDLIPIRGQEEMLECLREDLGQLSSGVAVNEIIASVIIDLNNNALTEFQKARPLSETEKPKPEEASFWELDKIRVFLSHRDSHKVIAHKFAKNLSRYAISCFVAHDNIEPDVVWRLEIIKALKTMEVMVVLISDNFYESVWTNQEVGFALGSNVPVVHVKIEKADPKGFSDDRQAIRANFDVSEHTEKLTYNTIAKRFGSSDRLKDCVLKQFVASDSFRDASHNFSLIEQLSGWDKQQATLMFDAYNTNSQISDCYSISKSGKFRNFLERITGDTYKISGGKLIQVKRQADIPF